jgi:hypothetical protein
MRPRPDAQEQRRGTPRLAGAYHRRAVPDEMSDETLAFLFDLAKGAPDLAMDQIKSLQGRVTQAFTAATVLIGFAALVTSLGGHNLSNATLGALAAAGLAYALTTVVALFVLRPIFAWGLPNPGKLLDRYDKYPVPSIQQALMNGLVRDWPLNDRLVKKARTAATWAVRFVAAEGVAMVLALILSFVTSGAAPAHQTGCAPARDRVQWACHDRGRDVRAQGGGEVAPHAVEGSALDAVAGPQTAA